MSQIQYEDVPDITHISETNNLLITHISETQHDGTKLSKDSGNYTKTIYIYISTKNETVNIFSCFPPSFLNIYFFLHIINFETNNRY